MNEINSYMYPEVYENLGIDVGALGCIMVDTKPIVVSDVIDENDYYYSTDQKWVQGNVSENVPHCTLLFGLMQSGHAMKKHVNAVLKEWTLKSVKIDKISFFYSSDKGDYITIVALLDVTDELREGNARLRLLPHVDTFAEYHPHITLAYVKSDSNWQSYVDELNRKYAGFSVDTVGLNYGDE